MTVGAYQSPAQRNGKTFRVQLSPDLEGIKEKNVNILCGKTPAVQLIIHTFIMKLSLT